MATPTTILVTAHHASAPPHCKAHPEVGTAHAHIHGDAHLVGDEVTVYEADGYTFKTEAEADAFATADWPRPLPDGTVVTSDRVRFPASKADQAAARQTNLGA